MRAASFHHPNRFTHRPNRSTPHADRSALLDRLVQDAAARHHVAAPLIHCVIAAESGGRPHRVSRRGARGLMQLMPATARQFGANARSEAANIEGGTRYLAHLLRRYRNRPDGVRCALAAYNAGPSRVARYHGVPPIRETRKYVREILLDVQERMGKTAEADLLAQAQANGEPAGSL